MAELKLHRDGSVGPCIACGKESEGSQYWVAMSHEVWLKLVPHIEHMFPVGRLLKGTFFIPPYDKPLCSANCALSYEGHQ